MSAPDTYTGRGRVPYVAAKDTPTDYIGRHRVPVCDRCHRPVTIDGGTPRLDHFLCPGCLDTLAEQAMDVWVDFNQRRAEGLE